MSAWRDPAGAAAHANVSTSTILRAARRGSLHGYKVGDGRKLWRFRDEDIDAWIEKRTTPSPVVVARRSA
jgi:excisionase family DNA binding protein